MREFYTRDKANEGKKVPLRKPAGEATEHWLQVRSQWSDEFRRAKDHSLRATAKRIAAEEDPAKRIAIGDEESEKLLAHLVADWSSDQPCTIENVAEFLKNAPQVAEQVNRIAGNDRLFFPSTD